MKKKLLVTIIAVLILIAGLYGYLSSSSEVTYEESGIGNVKTQEFQFLKAYTSIKSLASIKKVICCKFSYSSDDNEVIGYLSKPANASENNKMPIVIYLRGGNRSYGQMTDRFFSSLARHFFSKGYIVLTTQYRGVDGGTGTDEFGGDDVNDVLNLIKLAKSLSYADANNVFLFGVSRGGMMAYEVCKADSTIRAAVIDSGVADLSQTWNTRDEEMRKMLMTLVGGSPAEVPEAYEKRSAVKWAEKIDVPLLILHSEEDERVAYSEATDMVEQLEKYNKNYKFLSFKGNHHGALFSKARKEIFSWFEKYQH